MAIVNPEQRASAVQMLVKYYNRVGLTILQTQVLALISSPSPLVAAGEYPAPVLPTFITRTAQTKPRLPKNRNIFAAAAARLRVEKTQVQPIRRLQELRRKLIAKS